MSQSVSSRNPLSGARPQIAVLSLQFGFMGIATYSHQMRAYFERSQACSVDSLWFDQEKMLAARMVRRLLVLDDKWPKTWLRRQNLDFHALRRDAGMAWVSRCLARRWVQGGYDVLHFHTQFLGFFCRDLMRRIPTVIQTDATAAQLAEESAAPRWRWTFGPNRWLDRQVFDAAATLVVWSDWTRRSLIDDYRIAPEKVRVIHPGVDLDRFPARLPRRKTEEVPVKLLFAGYDFERKGGQDVLAVFLEHFTDVAELHLMTTAPVACSHPRVHIHSDVTAYSPEWLSLYENADVFVMPTRHEAFGLVYVEAMAASLPVIATRINAIPEIVMDSESGLLIPPGDRDALARALSALIGDRALRERLGRRGRALAEERFDARRNFAALEQVFAQVAGRNAH